MTGAFLLPVFLVFPVARADEEALTALCGEIPKRPVKRGEKILLTIATAMMTLIVISFVPSVFACAFCILLSAGSFCDARISLVPDKTSILAPVLLFLAFRDTGFPVPDPLSVTLAGFFSAAALAMGLRGLAMGDMKFIASFSLCGGFLPALFAVTGTLVSKMILEPEEAPLMPHLAAWSIITLPFAAQ